MASAIATVAVGVLGARSSKKAAEAQQEGIDKASGITRQQFEQARQDVKGLFSGAREASRAGFQGALDVFGRTVPLQIGTIQQGNVAAQESLLAGLPQIQSALLGGPVDLSGLQARQIEFGGGPAQAGAGQALTGPAQGSPFQVSLPGQAIDSNAANVGARQNAIGQFIETLQFGQGFPGGPQVGSPFAGSVGTTLPAAALTRMGRER